MRLGQFLRGLCALTVLAAALRAQQPAAKPRELPLQPPDQPYRLHVYANLVQVATILVDKHGDALDLTRDNVRIRLDGGPPFLPTSIKSEGDDPLSLAVVFDASDGQRDTTQAVINALPGLIPESLHPDRDHITFFAVDCVVARSPIELPLSAALMPTEIQSLLRTPGLHGQKAKPACSNRLPLWDAVSGAATALAHAPGRRILLIVAQGFNGKSRATLQQVLALTAPRGISVFGIRDKFQYEVIGRALPDDLYKLAVGTGGTVFSVAPDTAADGLARFLKTVRGRYILEFIEPGHAESGTHRIEVELPDHPDATIRISGATVPLPDPTLREDPTTLPSADSPAVFGTRRPKEN